MTDCPRCERPIEAGERRLSWFAKDANGFTTERGAVHLDCPSTQSENGSQ